MKQLRHLMIVLLAMPALVLAQDKKAQKYAKDISVKDLYQHLSILASDSLEGRETGEKGQKLAAEYLRAQFEKFGLEAPVSTPDGKSYFQTYPLYKQTYLTTYLKKPSGQKDNLKDFLYYSNSETRGEEWIQLTFINEFNESKVKKMNLKDQFVCVVNRDMEGWREMMAALEGQGAAGVVLILEDTSRFNFVMGRFGQMVTRPKLELEQAEESSKIILGNPALAAWLFDQDYATLKTKPNAQAKVILNADWLTEQINAENVLGFLPGTDKTDEVLVITAHYDHIGISADGQINNGADDDGSGTSAVLELAQSFAEAAKKGDRPRRSILFMAVSGEEKGLLGSKYYVENPVFPLKNTVANLNIDMIGRVDDRHANNPFYIYLIGSDKLSQDLHQLSEKANETYTQLELDYTYNDENDPNRYYYRSDHYNFVKNGVPIIFYFNGTHADYHKPTDTIEKIHFDKMERISRLVFFTAWEIANREQRIQLD